MPPVYLSLPDSANEPPKRLVGFAKVELQPGEKKRVQITIDSAASNHPLSFWDAEAEEWSTPAGEFDIRVGSSSGDVTLSETLKVRSPVAKK